MSKCKEITELISYSNEYKLNFRQDCAVKMHLLICPYCRAFKQNNAQLRSLINQFKQKD
ncbi:MAG: zf-HC2 domain-containing protein [Pasteurellaceae bacterium]|nr:zf-HC2 domain-containing protein [Pasteurellaceae bacterium]